MNGGNPFVVSGYNGSDCFCDRMADCFDGITWYVQTVMNRLGERGSVTEADVGAVIKELLVEKSWEYAALLKSLPRASARLLKAIPKAGCVKEPTGEDFLVTIFPWQPFDNPPGAEESA